MQPLLYLGKTPYANAMLGVSSSVTRLIVEQSHRRPKQTLSSKEDGEGFPSDVPCEPTRSPIPPRREQSP